MKGMNAVVERHLDLSLAELESQTNADAIAYIGGILPGCDTALRDVVERCRSRPKKRNKLVVVLETNGGYISTVERMVTTIRNFYKTVEFVVPDIAMSAGTVFVMSGDVIHMDYFSVLGPIDPQIRRPGGEGLIPALGYLAQYKRFMEKSAKGELTTAELAFLVKKFDPAELYQYEQARTLSINLLEQWLVKYKFKNWKVTTTQKVPVTAAMRRKRAQEIGEALNDTNRWNSHGRGISMEILRKELKLEVEDFATNPTFGNAVREYYGLLGDYIDRCNHAGAIHATGMYVPLGRLQ